MNPPTAQEVKVATDVVRVEAKVWDQQSGQLAAAADKAQELNLTYLQAGIVAPVMSPYHGVVEQVTGRCREGQQRTAEVAATLRQVATTYDDEDARQEHAFRKLY